MPTKPHKKNNINPKKENAHGRSISTQREGIRSRVLSPTVFFQAQPTWKFVVLSIAKKKSNFSESDLTEKQAQQRNVRVSAQGY